MQSIPRGERKNSPVQQCPLHTAFNTKVWNATVNIVRSQPFQVGTQRLSHWLLHSACVRGVCQCNGRRQMIPLLCEITSTHCSDSPGRHPTGFTSAPKYISVIHSRLSRLFVSSSGSFSGWQQYSYVLFYQRWHRAGGSASLFSIRLAELSFCHLQGVQKCRTVRAVFSLFIEWLSPLPMKEDFFFS